MLVPIGDYHFASLRLRTSERRDPHHMMASALRQLSEKRRAVVDAPYHMPTIEDYFFHFYVLFYVYADHHRELFAFDTPASPVFTWEDTDEAIVYYTESVHFEMVMIASHYVQVLFETVIRPIDDVDDATDADDATRRAVDDIVRRIRGTKLAFLIDRDIAQRVLSRWTVRHCASLSSLDGAPRFAVPPYPVTCTEELHATLQALLCAHAQQLHLALHEHTLSSEERALAHRHVHDCYELAWKHTRNEEHRLRLSSEMMAVCMAAAEHAVAEQRFTDAEAMLAWAIHEAEALVRLIPDESTAGGVARMRQLTPLERARCVAQHDALTCNIDACLALYRQCVLGIDSAFALAVDVLSRAHSKYEDGITQRLVLDELVPQQGQMYAFDADADLQSGADATRLLEPDSATRWRAAFDGVFANVH